MTSGSQSPVPGVQEIMSHVAEPARMMLAVGWVVMDWPRHDDLVHADVAGICLAPGPLVTRSRSGSYLRHLSGVSRSIFLWRVSSAAAGLR